MTKGVDNFHGLYWCIFKSKAVLLQLKKESLYTRRTRCYASGEYCLEWFMVILDDEFATIDIFVKPFICKDY